MTITLQKPI